MDIYTRCADFNVTNRYLVADIRYIFIIKIIVCVNLTDWYRYEYSWIYL